MTGTAHDRVLRALAGAGPAGVMPADLPGLAGLDGRQCRRAVAQLIAQQLAERDSPRGRIRGTVAGTQAEALPTATPAQDPPRQPSTPSPAAEPDNGVRLADVDAATELLDETLCAMIRWLLSAACYRQHYRSDRPSGHPGGIATGPTNTGKTFIAHVVGQALGLNPADWYREVAKQPDGALWGRTIARDGGRYEFIPAPVLGYPFVCLDELGDARGDKQTAALRLLQGETRITVDGQQVDVAAVPYATTNQPLADVPESRRRRCACLGTAGLPPLPYGTSRRVLAGIPRLPLNHLKPSRADLTEQVLDRMGGALRACLTPAGLRLLDLRHLEAVALGRAGIEGNGDLESAAMDTVYDYLVMAATTGEAYGNWRARLRRWEAGEPEPAPAATTAASAAGRPTSGEDDLDGQAEALRDSIRATCAIGANGNRIARIPADVRAALDDYTRTGGEVPGLWRDIEKGIKDGTSRLRRILAQTQPTETGLARVSVAVDDLARTAEKFIAQVRAAAGQFAADRHGLEYERMIAELLAGAAPPPAIESGASGPPAPRPMPAGDGVPLYLALHPRRRRKFEAGRRQQAAAVPPARPTLGPAGFRAWIPG